MPIFQPFYNALRRCLIRDRYSILQKIRRAEALQKQQKSPDRVVSEIEKAIAQSQQQVNMRIARLPKPEFDATLPVNDRREEIKATIAQNQVVIICGETGSGKTTQIPKICLELGLGVYGKIGHTQPRRLATRAVASRLAHELKTPLGECVGYKVRFTEHTSAHTFIKLMTDGILLAETQSDRFLSEYDTIIIDEAHERSLNIDFLLGYLKTLLTQRKDLKIIVTSATIDAKRFSQHFNHAPVIEVSGRTYPVDILYRPLFSENTDGREIEMEEAIVDAADELWRQAPGDILVFLPGEREIRDTAEKLRKNTGKQAEILPLFARLSHEDQQRIFQPSNGRRIVLSTNVAETSLTVPGIRYVIDSGLVRVNRYSPRAKIAQLQIEKTSQASAQQRAGRCGRVSAGICIRLYDAADFLARPAFTDPEILRTSLAAVILRMQTLKLHQIEAFPFIDKPSSRQIADGYQLLHELGAIDQQKMLTPVGHTLARLPVDPKIGRILLAAEHMRCLTEILQIASVLSIQDPRERPAEAREAADRAQARFVDEKSDFLSYLHLWHFFEEALRHKRSNRQLIDLCHQHFLSHLRLREWRDLHGQLSEVVCNMGWRLNDTPADYTVIHQALLTGLLTQIGMKQPEGDAYVGTRDIKFHIFPGSCLKKTRPKWIVAAELIETSRIYAHCAAAIDAAWLESIAAHLVKRHYYDARWEEKTAQVVASERVMLFGLPIIPQRKIHYGSVDPVAARDIFIREALVNQRFHTTAAFFVQNRILISEVEELEHKSRRQDVLVNDELLFSFYNTNIPADIVNGQGFEAWLKHASPTEKMALLLDKNFLMQHAANHITETQFPENFVVDTHELPLRYRFEPGHVMDGVTLTLPLHLLNRLDNHRIEWLVPGLLREKLNALIKSLPKPLRRLCVPLPDFVTRILEYGQQFKQSMALLPQLAQFIQQQTGHTLTVNDFQSETLPLHLQMNIEVVDEAGQVLAMGRDLAALKLQLSEAAKMTLSDAPDPLFQQSNIQRWDFGDLPAEISFRRGPHTIIGYPALIKEGTTCALRLFDTAQEAERQSRQGIIHLMILELNPHKKMKSLSPFTSIALQLRSIDNADHLMEDLLQAVYDRAFIGDDPLPRTEQAYQSQKVRARTRLPAVCEALLSNLVAIADAYQRLRVLLAQPHPLQKQLLTQLQHLLYPGFLHNTPYTYLIHVPRYLQAMHIRYDKYHTNPARDQQHSQAILRLWERFELSYANGQQKGQDMSLLLPFRWMIEELRVSLFAQSLRTPVPVSIKRVEKIWADLQHASPLLAL